MKQGKPQRGWLSGMGFGSKFVHKFVHKICTQNLYTPFVKKNLYTIFVYKFCIPHEKKKLHQNSDFPFNNHLRKQKIGLTLLLGFLSDHSKFSFHSMLLSPSKVAKYISIQKEPKKYSGNLSGVFPTWRLLVQFPPQHNFLFPQSFLFSFSPSLFFFFFLIFFLFLLLFFLLS